MSEKYLFIILILPLVEDAPENLIIQHWQCIPAMVNSCHFLTSSLYFKSESVLFQNCKGRATY